MTLVRTFEPCALKYIAPTSHRPESMNGGLVLPVIMENSRHTGTSVMLCAGLIYSYCKFCFINNNGCLFTQLNSKLGVKFFVFEF